MLRRLEQDNQNRRIPGEVILRNDILRKVNNRTEASLATMLQPLPPGTLVVLEFDGLDQNDNKRESTGLVVTRHNIRPGYCQNVFQAIWMTQGDGVNKRIPNHHNKDRLEYSIDIAPPFLRLRELSQQGAINLPVTCLSLCESRHADDRLNQASDWYIYHLYQKAQWIKAAVLGGALALASAALYFVQPELQHIWGSTAAIFTGAMGFTLSKVIHKDHLIETDLQNIAERIAYLVHPRVSQMLKNYQQSLPTSGV